MESEEEEGSQWSPGPAAVAAIEGEEYLAARRLQIVLMMIMTIIYALLPDILIDNISQQLNTVA